MKIQFKKLHPNAVKPTFAKPGDAGADLVATTMPINTYREQQIVYGTGLAVEIPEGMVGLIFPCSSIRSCDLIMANSVGVIDSGYRGEILITFNITKNDSLVIVYDVGDRIAQLLIVPVPLVEYVETQELSETERGTGGHGSTGV
jgi:dUTP pyrophosphatase